MKILFVHQNFPGQFRHTARSLAADSNNTVVAVCINQPGYPTPGVRVFRYKLEAPKDGATHPLATDFETKIIRGSACAAMCLKLRQNGFEPDVIVAHPGWGEHFFVKDIWPNARVLMFLEFFYRSEGFDYAFDPEFSTRSVQGLMRLRARNSSLLTAFDLMDRGVSPTRWQKSSLPERYQPNVQVVFDGIDTDLMVPDASAAYTLPDGRVVRAGNEILTFVNRNLEPYRGFHIFMRALPAIQKARPEAITLIVGGDSVSYGALPRDAKSWREVMMREVGAELDMSRIAFLGRIPYSDFRKLLQVSRVHAYLTYPFVLSWSMLEAMSCGCHVIGSSTGPVRELIEDGKTGQLVDFFDVSAWSQRISESLSTPQAFTALRKAAREHIVAHYDLERICLPQQLDLISSVLNSRQ
ncbi:RfaG Glycosyltransferase [Rhabdaerophilaceae bacterium]